ncbi:NAD(P)-dependent oxidoreductase [Halobacteria archaeon HArc-gm2]|nr:NAD(P)-dependent oxidoreductase [Halobacteria archaeon HArc-gm2]
MRVFVAGATGVLGHRLVARLTDRGHDIVGLTRDEAGDVTVRENGGTPVRGDLLDATSVSEAMPDSVDGVVHAATAIPTKRKPDRTDWEATDRLRREGTEHLTAAAARADVDRYVQQSVVWVARQPDGSQFDEASTPHPVRTTAAALDGEEIAADAADEHGFDVLTLRGGWFYGPDAAHTRQMGEALLARRMPIPGAGLLGRRDAVLSPIHVADAARAFAAAVEGDATGLYHVVDDEPVTFAQFLRTFARYLEAPTPRRIPGWLARYLAGPDTVELVTNSMPTTNDRFRAAFDWEPEHATYESGLARVVDRWRADGVVRERDGGVEWTG